MKLVNDFSENWVQFGHILSAVPLKTGGFYCCCLLFLLPCPKTFSALFALLIVLLVEGNVWTR